MITPQELVNREVHYCISGLVATLASGLADGGFAADLAQLCEQAMELAAPIEDWEEAAIQEGWAFTHDELDRALCFQHTDGRINYNTTWGELCDEQGIEPYQLEVFEHWIVSEWLADKLEAKGEKVDKDFCGMVVWARTTTGQAIYADGVIEQITEDLNKCD